MIRKEKVVENTLGLHARTAVTIVEALKDFQSEVFFIRDDVRVSAKSILGLLMLEACQDTVLTLEVSGEDEEAAMAALVNLFDRKFDED